MPRELRILVVDDYTDQTDSSQELLGLMGYRVEKAYDGASAIELVQSFRPDVVLLDLAMLKMSGYDVARAIRQLPDGHSMRIIAVTGHGRAEDRRRTAEAGFDLHLVKPVTCDELERTLQQVLAAFEEESAPPKCSSDRANRVVGFSGADKL
jgi:CheY-like chemotaxis protein